MSGREQAETGFPQRFSSAGSLLGDKTRGGGRKNSSRKSYDGGGGLVPKMVLLFE